MPLDLSKFLPDDEEIIYKVNGKPHKLFITSDIPLPVILDMESLYKVKPGAVNKKHYEKIIKIIKDIFYIRNEAQAVDSFVNSLGPASIIRVMTFITEYLKRGIPEEKKNSSGK